MGKPQNGDELCPSDLDAIVTKPFGLPVVSIARDDAMASAALSGFQFAGSSCNDSGWLMDEGTHEVASLPHFGLSDYASTWPRWDGTVGRVLVQSSQEKDVIPHDDYKSERRKDVPKGDGQELRQEENKKCSAEPNGAGAYTLP